MLGPHIVGLTPVTSRMSLSNVRLFSRRRSSATALRKAVTLARVGLVFASAMCGDLRDRL
jgi:hypothetical protein